MEIRTEINKLSENLLKAAQSYDGSPKICLDGVDIAISDLSKSLLGQQDQGIKGKLDIYEKEEMSLKRRLVTAFKLRSALEEISIKIKSQTPTNARNLADVIQRTNQITSTTRLAQELLNSTVSHVIHLEANEYIDENYIDLSFTEKVKKNAYRTIKGVSGLFESILADSYIGGSRQLVSFLTLQQDLKTFLLAYDDVLTNDQYFLIVETIPLLLKCAEIEKNIFYLRFLYLNKAAPSAFIESTIADIAYDIEKSIDSLKEGETIIFPGGYADKNSGHAILYEVQKTRNDEYYFSIFNTGSGAEFGQSSLQKFKIATGSATQSSVPLFTRVKKDALIDQKFLMDLLRFKVINTPNQMRSVHETITKQLQEKFHAELTIREPHDLQSWGTCSYDSVASFLEYKLPPSIFIPFQYDMMLRARNELNSLLKDQPALQKSMLPGNFIDQKSCATISEWKSRFDTYCAPYNKEDLTLARIIKIQNMQNQNELKKLLEKWSDHDISAEKKLDFAFSIGTKIFTPACWETGGLLYPYYVLPATRCAASFFFLSTPIVPGMMLADWDGTAPKPDELSTFRMRKQILWRIQDLIKQESPEAAKMLEDRYQTLGSGNQPVLGKEIDLSGVFNYLKNRFKEIALCIPSLLNSNSYPLNETIAGCPNLMLATEHYDWQSKVIAAL